jgi:hypothetical protein
MIATRMMLAPMKNEVRAAASAPARRRRRHPSFFILHA